MAQTKKKNPPSKSNPAGSKLKRQLERGNKGFTCRSGQPINKT
jgi:hypothetical protein